MSIGLITRRRGVGAGFAATGGAVCSGAAGAAATEGWKTGREAISGEGAGGGLVGSGSNSGSSSVAPWLLKRRIAGELTLAGVGAESKEYSSFEVRGTSSVSSTPALAASIVKRRGRKKPISMKSTAAT
jgi:hypothetical protein